MNTSSVKQQQLRQRQGPIGLHCDAPKWVPDPFPSVMASVKTSMPLGVFIPLRFILTHFCETDLRSLYLFYEVFKE